MKTYSGIRDRSGNGQNYIVVTGDGCPTHKLDIADSQKVYNHSAEFDWGYGGSGPSQTAMAILLDYLGKPEEALKHYQDFKWRLVSAFDENWRITGKEIDAWLLEVRQGSKGFTGSPKAPIGGAPPSAPPKPIQG